jgi:hypothetical protein
LSFLCAFSDRVHAALTARRIHWSQEQEAKVAMLGRYIDALPDEALERIRTASSWRTHGYVDASGARCLLGHAENWYWGEDQETHCADPDVVECRTAARDHMYNWPPFIGVRYDHLVEKHGLDRMIQLFKLRAAQAQRGRSGTLAIRLPQSRLQT